MTQADSLQSNRWHGRRWWPFVALGSLLIVAATATASPYISPINLAGENNLAVWWSGGLYFLAAIHALAVAMRSGGADRVAWSAYAIAMMVMLCTEIGSVHERFVRHGVAGTVAVLLLGSFLLMWRTKRFRVPAILLAGGVMMNALALLQEKIELSREWTGWLVGVRAAFEEGAELVASFLMVAAALHANCDGLKTSLRDLFGRLSVGHAACKPLAFAFVAGVGLSVWASGLTDLINRGNPSSLYPVVVYLLAATMTLRTMCLADGRSRRGLLPLALVLLYCSADAMCLFVWNALVYYPNPRAEHTVAVWASYQPIAYLSHAALVSLCLLGGGSLWRLSNLVLMAVVVAACVAAMVTEQRLAQLLLAPVTALCLLLVLRRSDVWASGD